MDAETHTIQKSSTAVPQQVVEPHAGTAPPSGVAESATLPASSSMKQFLDMHPLPVALTLAIGVATTVAGVMQYFHSQAVSRLEVDKAQAVAAAVTPLSKKVSELEQTAHELTRALASFPRTAGSAKNMFDIRGLLLDRGGVKTLTNAFTYHEKYDVYVAPPSSPRWIFEETSEGKLMERIDPGSVAFLRQLADADGPLYRKTLLLWRSPDASKFKAERGIDSVTAAALGLEPSASLQLFPFVAVQRVDRALLKDSLRAFTFDQKPEIDLSSSEPLKGSAEFEEAMAKLEDMFATDIAAAMLITQANLLMMMGQSNKDVAFRIATVEKRGPVLYLNAQLTFKNVTVAGKRGRRDVVMDREIMVTASGETAYVVITAVPTIGDGRSDAYAWVTQWLQNVRIPCECPTMSSLKAPV